MRSTALPSGSKKGYHNNNKKNHLQSSRLGYFKQPLRDKKPFSKNTINAADKKRRILDDLYEPTVPKKQVQHDPDLQPRFVHNLEAMRPLCS